ncbi:oxygenase MpaB family protein [Streptomyces sp. CL7]|uniref:oxygenase MpaB family protein n=1 Tax=Streptomyces sp. CL7 TaxID=3096006 RepID=UPI0039BE1336
MGQRSQGGDGAAHPQIGAAFVDNSTFVAHPWRRLRNTFLSMRRMFGADPAARERRTAFHRDFTTTDGTYSQSAFVGDFLSFASGRRTNTA